MGALSSVMAIVLLSYFGTMVAALVSFMLLLNGILAPSAMHRVRTQHYPMPAIEQALDASAPTKRIATTEKQPEPSSPPIVRASIELIKSTDPESAWPAAAKKTAAEKSKRVRTVHEQARKEDMAGRRQDQEYSTALGYAREAQQLPPLFDVLGPRRF
jgi:hypothetical protein